MSLLDANIISFNFSNCINPILDEMASLENILKSHHFKIIFYTYLLITFLYSIKKLATPKSQ